ncbi:MAG TPA: ATP synthase F1 subunit delta [Bryobacteraceae bacterium]|jgi:F-type H+-transporting ATPase subunit delta|nr:ATP synthase F1 subunit delta [Bryobacteraceae bacterium]
MQGALASHYARALADAVFATDSDLRPEAAVEQLRAVDELLSGSQQLQRALISPAVSRSRKLVLAKRLAEELGIHRKIRNFLLVLVSHRRTTDLSTIRRSFEEVVDERLGWVPAVVTSAQELSPPQREQIERALGTKLGKFIRAHYEIDQGLIGGVRARVASREYDATMRGKLEGLRRRLATV